MLVYFSGSQLKKDSVNSERKKRGVNNAINLNWPRALKKPQGEKGCKLRDVGVEKSRGDVVITHLNICRLWVGQGRANLLLLQLFISPKGGPTF
jgi:hypothetical protein